MSLTAVAGRPGTRSPGLLRRLAVVAAVLAAAFAVTALLGFLLGGGAAPAAPKNPFGTGLREAAAGPGGIGGRLLAAQAEFHRTLVATLGSIRREGTGAWALLAIGFLYGVFHAAGPGHGKGVIASYLLATRRTLARGLGLSTAAAFVQALVAIALVGILALVVQAGSTAINAAAGWIEIASFAALVAFGLALAWRKSGAVVAPGHGHHHPDHHHAHGHRHHGHHHEGCGAGCVHAVGAAEAARTATWRESATVVLAAGARPCSGAVILLVFGLSQGEFAVAVAAVLAMAAGTALTTGALAALAVLAKSAALRIAGGHGQAGERAVAWLELGAAALITALGAALLAGLWAGGLPG